MPELETLIQLGLTLVGTGLVAGVIAGLLGVGGGIVVVPVLFESLGVLGVADDVRMHVAVGTSLASVLATSVASARAHHKKGNLDLDLLKAFAPGIFLGTLIGTALAGSVQGAVLTLVFAGVAICVALFMGLTRPGVQLRPAPPSGIAGRGLSGGFIGGFSAMMGIGGGTLAVPFFSACGVPVHRAVGTAAAIGFIVALPGSAGFVLAGWGDQALPNLSMGFVNLLGLLVIAPATTLTVPLGAKIAHRLSPLALRRAFAIFLLLSAARMLTRFL